VPFLFDWAWTSGVPITHLHGTRYLTIPLTVTRGAVIDFPILTHDVQLARVHVLTESLVFVFLDAD
jgi:hypothetical protein